MPEPPKEEGLLSTPMGRRTFLKGCMAGLGVVAGATALGEWFVTTLLPDGTGLALARGVVLVNKAICSGCRVCEAVCSNFNSQGRTTSTLSRLILEKDYLTGNYEPKTCLQCIDPPCLRACPVAALQVDRQTWTYARVIDERVCIGCQKCLRACDVYFNPPRPRFDPEEYICIKCHLCFGDPQCVKYCPLGALRVEKSPMGVRTGYPLVRDI